MKFFVESIDRKIWDVITSGSLIPMLEKNKVFFFLKNPCPNGVRVKVKRFRLIVFPKILLYLLLILMSFSDFKSVFRQRICGTFLKELIKTQVELPG